ncbi:MAG TPA: hypothetical protein VKB10_09900 [Gaiellaceae bacterium]|nr:hypothetical protein [Gaiellaceae bacterium]
MGIAQIRLPQLLRLVRRGTCLALLCAGALLASPGSGGAASPSITPVIQGTAGVNGWYRSNVTVNWQISPLPSSSSGCDAVTLTADTTGRAVACTASWGDGTSISVRKVVRIDRGAPAVSPMPDRKPDANGWYNHPVGVTFAGTDRVSGIATCGRITYAGPDDKQALLTGTCADRAGNVASASYGMKYDSTAPVFQRVFVEHGRGAVTLRWQTSPDVRLSEVVRARAVPRGNDRRRYHGKAKSMRDRHLRIGRAYYYRVTVWDAAANSVSRLVVVTATGALTRPVPAARISKRPRLAWLPVYRASFYNVQLIRDHRKILSAWPTQTHLRLGWRWLYHGRHYRLKPGIYRWFVWPGYRAGGVVRYGPSLGGSSFVVKR